MEGKSKMKLSLSLLPELGCMALTALGVLGLSYAGLLEQRTDRMLCHIVLVVLGIGIVGFLQRSGMVSETLDYDNGKHIFRFWVCFLAGLLGAFVCVFLPAAAWPFLPLFVLLALFSNLSTGALAGAVLLFVPVCLTGSGAEVFLLYLVSGLFGAALFQRMKNDFKTGLPLLFSLACLLVCLTAGTVLTANVRPGFEHFVVPVVNLVISGILLFGILKYFFAKTIYSYRDNYLELNDPQNDILAQLKQRDRSAYLKGVHTAYFCERIANRLSMNADALKCAAYYCGMGERLQELLEEHSFPPEAVRILEDYAKGRRAVRYKETAVLMASDDIVSMVSSLVSRKKDKPIDYDPEIDSVFQGYYDEGVFHQCDISVRELQVMKRIFKEEKLYYDFLH